MKRLKHIISWIIWSLLALYLLVIILIHLPSVQGYLGRHVAAVIGHKLNTEVSVGRIGLGFLNRIIIDQVVVKDQQQQDLLTVGRLTARIQMLPLLDHRVDVSSVQLFGAHVNLYQTDSIQPANYQFVLDALSSPADTTNEQSFDVRVNSLIVRNSSVRWNRAYVPDEHLFVKNISAYIALKALRPDTLNLNVKRLAFQEQAGLRVDHFAAHVEANLQQARIDGFTLRLPHSTLRMDSLTATYQQPFNLDNLNFRATFNGTSIAPRDLSFIDNRLQQFSQILELNADVEGKGGNIHLPNVDIRTDDNTLNLQARATMSNIGKKDAQWKLLVHRLDVDNSLLTAFDLPAVVTRLGNLHVSGDAERLADGTTLTQSDILTDAGRLSARLLLSDDLEYSGHLVTDSFLISRLLDNDALGLIATQVDVSGNRKQLQAEGNIGRFDFKGYPYQNITLNATYQDGGIAGRLLIDDPNIQTELEGEVVDYTKTTNGEAPVMKGKKGIRLTGSVQNLSPRNLHLTDRWGDATFSTLIDADINGLSLNDIEGSLDIDDFTMTRLDSASSERRSVLDIDNLHMKSGYDDGLHYLRFDGDFGEVNLTGQFDWETLPQSFINFTASKLPTLPGLPKTLGATHNNFEMDIHLSDTEWLQQLLDVPLTLNSPIHLNALVNDEARQIDINGLLPSFTYNDSRYTGGRIDLTTLGDTAQCNVHLNRIDDNGHTLSLQLKALAAENNLNTSLKWDNHKDMSGLINAITQLYTNERNKSEAHMRLLPSHITLKGALWQLEPSDILYTDGILVVDYFNLHHDDQHLVIDGIASKSSTDTLLVDLKEIDIKYILDLVNFHSVDFGGLATGRACLVQPLDKSPKAWADLTVSGFEFLNGDMGTLEAHAAWNGDAKQIDIHAIADAGGGARTLVDGNISPSRSDIHLDIEAQNSPVTFIEDVTSSFIGKLDGRVRGHLLLSGELGAMNLTGKAAVDAEAFITPLNTTYTLQGDTIRLLPNEIVFDNWQLHDRRNHTGILTGGVHHKTLKDFTFDFDVDARNLLAYDFPDFGDGTVCGTVYATGHADIHGRPNEVTINCDVTPNANSFFAYNAANPDAISSQQFITWREQAKEVPEDHLSPPEGSTTAPSATKTTVAHSVAVGGASGGSSDLYINFRINTTPDATLRLLMDQHTGDYITLNGNGVLRASFYNKGPFQMFGTYQVERGTYGITIQNIIKKNFTFQNGGTIIFGGDPFDANLNLQALYTVSGVSLSDLNIGNSFTNNTVRVNCLMNIQGTAGQPRVEFDLEMPTVNSEEEQMIRSVIASEQELNQQVVYLLGIGRFYTQGANNAGTQQYGQTELAMQSFLSGTVSTQINEVLSQVIKSNDWNFGANISTGNEGWHNAEYEGLISGRMLNNRLLINGQFGYRDNATQATPSFIGDFDIRYLLTPNGNLALKVYNQTNDRYFTRSSLNTQGIGLIMKKDFNGLGDLFHSRRKKK